MTKTPIPDSPVTHDQIAQLAYSIHAERGYRPDHDQDDWFEAESRLRAQSLKKPASGSHGRRAPAGKAESAGNPN